MSKKIFNYLLTTIMVMAVCGAANAQTPGFVQQDAIKISGIIADTGTYWLNTGGKQTTRMYYDGLGRTLQTVAVQASPQQNDLIQPVAYDGAGRQIVSYLPYAGHATDAMGSYRPNAVGTDQPAFYQQTTQSLIPVDTAAHARQQYESSPLQRLLESGTVGALYQPGNAGAHYKTISYRPNTSADGSILIWNTDGTFSTRYYTAGTLSVTDATDEDGAEMLSFTDLEGHTILKRQILASGNLDTYYIYNMAGMIRNVVPPKATAMLGGTVGYDLTMAPLSNLVFRFDYNTLGQLIHKTVPSKGTMNIIYDPFNRPVLIQDAKMALANQWSYIKYDIKGRPISSGIYTDITHTTYAAMQTYVSSISYTSNWYESRSTTPVNSGYYTNNLFPTSNITPLAYAYYDDYNLTGTAFTYQIQSKPNLPGEETPTSAAVKGMPTVMTKTTVGAGLSSTWLTSVVFYDHDLHTIQVQSNNQVYYTGYNTQANLTDYKTVVNDFTGTPVASMVVKQTGASTSTTVYTQPTYDQVYRVTAVKQAYNTGAWMATAAYTYNEVGQVVAKNLGQVTTPPVPVNVTLTSYSATTVYASGSITIDSAFAVPSGSTFNSVITSATGYLQTVDYRYNIRGQLLTINNSTLSNDGGTTNNDSNDLFGMQFLYDQQDSNLLNTRYYNGKLSAVKWMSKDGNFRSSYERAYNYFYDQLNRDTAAIYNERPATGTGAFVTTHGWDENIISYDQNGNIKTLHRNDANPGVGNHIDIDNLTYYYSLTSPNQLQSVTDASGNALGVIPGTGNYTYDVNGNLTADPYKGITRISYDVLNRTDTLAISSSQYITYTYSSDGVLIRKQAYKSGATTQTTDYVDGFVYINNTLSYFPMPEGRVINNGTALVQEFIITDQQGNARISFQDNGHSMAVVKQENSYYPFGLIMPNSPVLPPAVPNKQLYNGGSEWQNDYTNLPDYYQTFNRNYDAALARFVGVDPQAEGAESMSGYQYAGNNPIMYNDPLGDKIKIVDPVPGVSGHAFDEEWNELQLENEAYDVVYGGGYDLGVNISNIGRPSDGIITNLYTATGIGGGSNRDLFKSLGIGTAYAGPGQGKSYYFDENGNLTNVLPNGSDVNDFNQDDFKLTPDGSGGEKYVNDYDRLNSANLLGDNDQATEITFLGKSFSEWYDAEGKIMAGENVPVILSSTAKFGRIAEIGSGVGIGIALTGLIMDYNAAKRNEITWTKFGINQAFSVLGLIPNPYTIAASAIYFGVDAFYPGGWTGVGQDVGNAVSGTWNQFVGGINEYNNIYKWVPHQ